MWQLFPDLPGPVIMLATGAGLLVVAVLTVRIRRAVEAARQRADRDHRDFTKIDRRLRVIGGHYKIELFAGSKLKGTVENRIGSEVTFRTDAKWYNSLDFERSVISIHLIAKVIPD